MTDSNKKPPWFKNPIVWMIIFFPSMAVIAGFNMLYLAIESDDGLVDSDYYKQGITINKTIAKDLVAIENKISGLININGQTGEVRIKFSDKNPSLDRKIEFKLVHRTIAGFDQHISLDQVDDTMLYTGTIKPLPKEGGRWRWEISHDDWRISERFQTKQQEVIVHSFP